MSALLPVPDNGRAGEARGEPAGAKAAIVDFLTPFSIETTPQEAARIPSYTDHLAPGTTVYVAHPPRTSFAQNLALTERLQGEGFKAVPHLPVRALTGQRELDERLRRWCDLGVDQMLLIAGDLPRPLGPFHATIQALETGLFERYGMRKIGLAGHPEGHPAVSRPRLRGALLAKLIHARQSEIDFYLVTQFGFDARTIIAWADEIRALGNDLPIHVGIPGPTSIKALLRYALACGVGPSSRMLTKQPRRLARLASAYTPDEQIAVLARHRAGTPEGATMRAHFFSFGGVVRTAAWLEAIRAGAFTMKPAAKGFAVTPEMTS